MPLRRFITTGAGSTENSRPALLALATLVGAGLAAILTLLPAALVLPAVSLLLLIVGFAVAALLAVAGLPFDRRVRHVTGWDLGGALMLVGFVAALLSDASAALAVIERWLTENANIGAVGGD